MYSSVINPTRLSYTAGIGTIILRSRHIANVVGKPGNHGMREASDPEISTAEICNVFACATSGTSYFHENSYTGHVKVAVRVRPTIYSAPTGRRRSLIAVLEPRGQASINASPRRSNATVMTWLSVSQVRACNSLRLEFVHVPGVGSRASY